MQQKWKLQAPSSTYSHLTPLTATWLHLQPPGSTYSHLTPLTAT